MAGLQADNLGDLVVATLKDLGEMKFTEIATDLQEHVAMRNLLKKNRVVLDSGYGIQWQLMVDQSGAAQFVGLYGNDNVNVGDVMKQATVPWRHCTTNYAFDAREIDMNRSPRRIVDLLKIRRIDAMISLAELMETKFWSVPAATDTTSPYGVPYYIVKSATASTTNNGFNGTVPSGYSDVAGLSPTTYPRWANYAAPYTLVSKDDFVRAARRAATITKFAPAVDNIPQYNSGDQLGYYTNYPVIAALEELLEAQNDDLGTDLASMDGKTLFRRVPVMWVPKLDIDTTGVFYGINWGVFKTHILRNWWLKETNLPLTPGQHTVASVFVDATLNWVCKDRRRNLVLSTGTTMP